ncbi:hypothetical protein N7582_004917 [Saccharomyces uvarum]|uniref:Uncharacterized protein n=1 Tax=Saccharomyces uvarum TaxID=230603 RepID=A0AA35J6I9_SACUV|nr:hypothetical protein N7582_004917 [Saccharomyces uvarum]CAI4050446.1 hypothetical protein SUVC_14G2680 [Saccharomyces uvarum]
MSELKVVSRKDLYDEGREKGSYKGYASSGSNNSEEADVLIPPTEFEFVEVERTGSDSKVNDEDANDEIEDNQDEFEFPLFSFGVVEAPKDSIGKGRGTPDGKENEAHTEVNLMKVSLKEPEEEIIDQERPKEYYFANYSEDQRQQFLQSAIDYDTIIKESTKVQEDDLRVHHKWPYCQGKIINLHEHNLEIASQQQRVLKIKKRRPGQKQRGAKKLALERIKERDAKAREIKKLLKKKFHKRGGKKNKKKTTLNPLANAGSTPKVRTG